MKKSVRKKLKLAFWAVFVVGALWVSFAPHTHRSVPSFVSVKMPPPPPLVEPATPLSVTPDAGSEITTAPVEDKAAGEGEKRARVAIVIDDVGVNLKESERVIRLPGVVTLSFLPYAVRLREQAKAARDHGHELLLHIPMEPEGRENPGEGALMVDLPQRDLQDRIENALASFTGFDGVNNHMGSKFTASEEGMGVVMDELRQRDLFFLDSRTSAQTVGKKVADHKGVSIVSRDVFLDDDPAPAAVRKQLESVEQIARQRGVAIAIGHPHPATIGALEAWLVEAPQRGIDVVPVNVLVGRE